jgi:ribosomal protein S18 acetylase RimI-like enzyme
MAENRFIIRKLEAADAEAFREVRLRGLAEHPEAFTSTVEEWDGPLEKFVDRIQKAHVVGAFEAQTGKLVGHIILATHISPSLRQRHKCEVWSVYVLPEARGHDLARRMMEAIIAEGRAQGFLYLKLAVSAGNDKARSLYESLGFVHFGTEPDYKSMPDGGFLDEHFLQLKL